MPQQDDPNIEPTTRARLGGLIILYVDAAILGAIVFAALMRISAIFGPGVMFYRGVVALALTGLVLLVVSAIVIPRLPRRLGLDAADSLGGAIVATSMLTAFFVLGPVTVDRSVSVFMLSQFEAAEKPMSADETKDRFARIYLGAWDQVGRRLSEQQLSGNLERVDGGWRLTPQGRRFMSVARAMSAWFGGDPRFVGR